MNDYSNSRWKDRGSFSKEASHSYQDIVDAIRTAPTPEEQEITESVPYRQGSYDFSMIDNERFFNNREITYKLLYVGEKYHNRKGFEQELNRQAQDLEKVKVIVGRVAEVQASGQSNVSSTTTIIQNGASSEDVTQLKFDIKQLQTIINDRIPAGYVSQADFNALKAEVDKLKGDG